MAVGILQPERGKRTEDVGKAYLNSLISRSFFQRSSSWYGSTTLRMHDLVHDLAMRISGEFCSTLDSCNYKDHLTSRTYHLSYHNDNKDVKKLEGLSKITHLKTLLALPLSSHFLDRSKWGGLPVASYHIGTSTVTDTFLHELLLGDGGCLKVLSLSQSSITELPNSIGNLTYLRGTPLKEMPPQLCKLRTLHTLSDFILGENGGSRIKELGELQSMHGSLFISGLENVLDVGDVLQADLKNKKGLTELVLSWDSGKTDDSTKERKVLAALEPHKKVKKLSIGGYGGTTFPEWVAQQSFNDMVEMCLHGCKNCCLLPPLGQLPSLRELRIVSMDGLESIGDEFCGSSLTKPFPSLEILHISRLDSFEKWMFTEVEQKREIFPRLKSILVESCGKLNVGLPEGCFPSLETISIGSCFGEMVSVFPTSQVEIYSAYPSLQSIKLRHCNRLESFSGMGLPSSVKKLGIMGCRMLIANRMNWDLQRCSTLQELSLAGYDSEGDQADSFPDEELLPSALTSLDISSCRNVKFLNGKSLQHLTSLQRFGISFCQELQCLPEEGLPQCSKDSRKAARGMPAYLFFFERHLVEVAESWIVNNRTRQTSLKKGTKLNLIPLQKVFCNFKWLAKTAISPPCTQ
ncbi:hypothetical protein TIFTF001_034285 [Ficus carica]|uniref:Uncharacterized protein n=1 Tax=Ficus carica TaxID=3494 RepID=A0AA88E2H5_FICCA|nr:hypothetical protein TIFTF001_034285 [Ficus carica]